jgi:hypothetical protein
VVDGITALRESALCKKRLMSEHTKQARGSLSKGQTFQRRFQSFILGGSAYGGKGSGKEKTQIHLANALVRHCIAVTQHLT